MYAGAKKLLTYLELSLKDLMLAGLLLSVNQSTFALVEGPIIWLYTCDESLSPPYIQDDL